ncbi:angio-associated migratory cell protein-like isoform X2 [Stegodyphus dumicola]|uniref:angio-associated migratory cell protein-like isoform X2 n=1 Tax=Stegodyphus dumicola TaxID=202533 RepID=UPI0015B1EAA8|nr:angio-associated migratory cell protein-like isoform X2 [Stegodyphus dumicola]
MPCDTPPPPPGLGTADGDDMDEDVDEQAYWIVNEDDIEEIPLNDDSILTFECHRGHSESVIAADFSYDDSFVATADMNGFVQVWNVNSGSKVCDFDTSEIMWMEWHNTENMLFAGTTDGCCWKWGIPDGETSLFQTHGFGSSSGKLLPDGCTCAIGYMDGSIKLWDISNCCSIGNVSGPAAHKKSVLCLACHPNNGLILSGSEDGTAKLIKQSTSKVLWTLDCTDVQNAVNGESVESVGFFDSHPHAATGTNCGNLIIWDIPSQVKRSTCKLEVAIVKLICDKNSHLIYVGSANGELELYDGRTGHCEKKWAGHELSILDFTLSRDGEKILTSSDDYSCKIFKVR